MLLIIFSGLYIVSVFMCAHYESATIIFKIFALLMGLVYLFDTLKSHKRIIEINSCHILFGAWIFVAFFSSLIAGTGTDAYSRAWTVLQLVLVSLVLYGTIVHRPSIEWLAWAVVLGVLISALGVDLNLLPQSSLDNVYALESERFSATMENANLFGYCCVIAIAMIFYLWRMHRQILIRLCFIMIAGYLSFKIVETGSRKAILGFVGLIGIEYWIYLMNRSFNFKAILRTIIATTLTLVILGSFWFLVRRTEQSSVRMRNLGHFIEGERLEGGEGSIYTRVAFIHEGLKLFYANPVIGTGFSSFSGPRQNQFQNKAIGTYSHCNYIEVLVSSGLLGFIIYYSMYVILFIKVRHLIKVNKTLAFNDPSMHFILFFLPYSLFFDLFAVTYYGKEFWIFFSALLGCIALMENLAVKQPVTRKDLPGEFHKISPEIV
jgi:hypothetical protein